MKAMKLRPAPIRPERLRHLDADFLRGLDRMVDRGREIVNRYCPPRKRANRRIETVGKSA